MEILDHLTCLLRNLYAGQEATVRTGHGTTDLSVFFSQGKPFNITVIQVYAPTSNAEEAEVKWFYEDLQDLLELTPKKDVHFI